MKYLSSDKFKRDQKVKGILKQKANTLYVTEDCSVLVPERYSDIGMMDLKELVGLVSVFPLINKRGKYALANMPARVYLSPYLVIDVMVDDVPYKELLFKSGEVFMEDMNIIKNVDMTNPLFSDFFLKGKIPWYMGYEDLAFLYRLSKKYAGSNIGNNPKVLELLTSIIARDERDLKVYYRTVENKKQKPAFVSMESVYYSYASTINKLVGSYMSKGIVSALVNPTEGEASKIERILRS